MEIALNDVPFKGEAKRDDVILFSESNSRFIVEVKKEDRKKFESLLEGIDFGLIGETKDTANFKITGRSGKTVIDADINELKKTWQKPFSEW